jgi:hypothetical protein
VSRFDADKLQRQLLASVALRLSKYGFDPRVHGQSVWKNSADGRASIHLGFIEHDSDFDVTVDVAIRIDALEDLVNTGKSLLSKREQRGTYSLGAELGNLAAGRQNRWTIIDSQDINLVVPEIESMILAFAMPYIENYSHMKNALELFSRDDADVWIHSPIHHERAKRAVGLAKLVGVDDTDLNNLITRKQRFLTARKEHGLDGFLRFVERIKETD